MTHYERLEVAQNCDFTALKKAYYRKVRTCHPDLFGNSPEKNEEFKLLVEAFNILSDPEKRYAYNLQIRAAVSSRPLSVETIMDSESDDTLEELIVGNKPPEDATLMTLFRDLERTLVFVTWREARGLYLERRFKEAVQLFLRLVAMAPDNILYRVYLARSFSALREYSRAKYHYRAALNIGERRRPPQNLYTVRDEFERVSRKKNPLIYRIIEALSPKKDVPLVPSDEQMLREISRAMQRMLDEQERKNRSSSGKLLK